MKFGVNLINFGPGANPESLTRSVNLVEAIGYHLIMCKRRSDNVPRRRLDSLNAMSKLSDYVRLSVKGKCPPSELLDYHTTMRQLMSGVRST